MVRTAAGLLISSGWDDVTHAEVARQSGYSKATIYTYWPTRLDLMRDAVGQICDEAQHPTPSGDLRTDLVLGLTDFASDLTGRLARLLGGVIERSGSDPIVEELRRRLYDTGTTMLRTVLESHLAAEDVAPVLALLTGRVFVRIAFEGLQATPDLIEDLVVRALASTQRHADLAAETTHSAPEPFGGGDLLNDAGRDQQARREAVLPDGTLIPARRRSGTGTGRTSAASTRNTGCCSSPSPTKQAT